MDSKHEELRKFPYVNYGLSDSLKEKRQCIHKPEGSITHVYRECGHRLIAESDPQEMYRFNVQMRTFTRKEGDEEREYDNMVTLSKPSAEVICTRINEDNGMLEICLILQPRTPYITMVDGEKYARFFMEQPAGLVEKDETIEEAAVREVEEEIGYEVEWIRSLIVPFVCRHVSYTNETSKVFVVGVGTETKQHLDKNEDIQPVWHLASDVELELDSYLDGLGSFYGFDLPEMTILALQRFFTKLHRGDIKELKHKN